MKHPHISLLAGLAICVVAAILVICKIEDNRKYRNAASTIFRDNSSTSVEHNPLMHGDKPISTRRERPARENLGVLSRLGFVLTADDIGDHKAKGNVKIITPNGIILRSDRMSISPDGTNIYLHGSVVVTKKSLILKMFNDTDSFARIALDGSSQTFTGTPMFEPGNTFIGQKRNDIPPIDFLTNF